MGNHLLSVRREHEDRMFLQRYEIERNKELFQDFNGAQAEHKGGDPFYQPLEERWTKSSGETLKRIEGQGFRPSKAAIRRAQEIDMDLRGRYGIKALEWEHNAAVTHLQSTAEEDRNAILTSFAQNGDFEAALSSVDQIAQNAAPLLDPQQEQTFRAQGYKQLEASLYSHLDSYQDEAVGYDTEEDRQFAIDRAEGLIDRAVAKGVIDPAVGEQQKRVWTTQYVKRAAGAMDPSEVLRLADQAPDTTAAGGGTVPNWQASLRDRESGGRPGVVNSQGYAGLYQFGSERLAHIGVYEAGGGENLSRNDWTGEFKIPGHPEVRTLQDFLSSPAAQEKAFQLHQAQMDKEIQSNGFDRYIGQEVGGVQITREGLYAMLHIGGVGGARSALTGKGNRRDSNGTSVLDYAAMAGRAGGAPVENSIFASVPEDVRQGILEDARRRNSTNNKVYLAGVEDYASYLRDGNDPTGQYSPDEIYSRLGQEAGSAVVTALQQAEAYGQKVQQIQWATPEELQGIAASERQRLESPQDYQRVSKEVGSLMKAIEERNTALVSDPARYVMQDEGVQASYARMAEMQRTEGATPEQVRRATRNYAETALAEQERLGLPPEARRILPAQTAAEMARQFRQQPEGGQNAAVAMQAMARQWGEHWPQVFADMQGDLPGTALVIGMMEGPDQRLAAERLAEASLVGAKALKENLPGDKTRDLNDNILAEMDEFQGTLNMLPGGDRTFGTVREGVELLALSYMSEGDSQENAITRAYNDVVGKRYNIEGTYRIPVEQDRYAVRDGAASILSNLGEVEGLDLPFDDFGLPEDELREQYISSLEEFGYWVTAPDESGLLLYRPDQKAATVNGRPFVVPWEDLEGAGVENVGSAVPSNIGGLGLPTGRAAQMPEIEVIMPEDMR